VPELGAQLLQVIRTALPKDKPFKKAFENFASQCRQAINPNLANAAIEEMLIQHLLTERIFRNLFKHPDFGKRNIIARDIEAVIEKLTAKSFNRDAFFAELQYFYQALEVVAATISEYSYKQHFLNTIYERFFQGFSVKVADTHGIVYTPQPIVDFMVRSVEEILQREFGRSLVDKGVHILDPFVGTGNFITRVIREIAPKGKRKLDYKYQHELHCNEIMLLPYYLACMNIEHQYVELMGRYRPFEGICLADTFELAENRQIELFVPENTERVKRQKKKNFFVIIGNPPYNASQANENDNNKNQTYPTLDGWVRDTYAKDSTASNKNDWFDPYVKARKWASERIENEGIVAFVTNNGFLDNIAFDGMRKHLEQDFSKIYLLNLGGNVRKNPKLSGTTHNVFGIQIGVSINLLIKRKSTEATQIFYASLDEYWRKEEKYRFLDSKPHSFEIDWLSIESNKKHIWLTEGLHEEFEEFIPLGTKKTKAKNGTIEDVVFKNFSLGVNTNRDAWVYSFIQNTLTENVKRLIEVYNSEIKRWYNHDKTIKLDDFGLNNETKIKWSSRLKECLLRGQKATFAKKKIRHSLYRPFGVQFLFFDEILNHRQGQFPKIFPTPETEAENQVICVSGIGSNKPFHTMITDMIPCLDLLEKTQCFPFYTYNEDGSNRTENITDWALNHWQQHYQDKKITKWDIFYYTYGLLHHPQYRDKYAQNLKRELPRLPLTLKFWNISKAGHQLADLHLNYEQAKPYELEEIENPKYPYSLEVEKMRLSKDKSQLIYNQFLTLKGIPKPVFDYKLGNRSALEWVIDQYRGKVDKRSGIVNNPNRKDDEEYILQLIGKIITVSLETLKILSKMSRNDRHILSHFQ
jgi:predicted helicase